MVVGVGTAGLGLKAALGALIKAVGTKAAGKAAATSVIRPALQNVCLLYTSPSPRDRQKSRMPSSA